MTRLILKTKPNPHPHPHPRPHSRPHLTLGEGDTSDDAINSNDGKRSEWCDFLQVGDTVQLIPRYANIALTLLQRTLAGAGAGAGAAGNGDGDGDGNGSTSSSIPVAEVPVVGVRREGRPRGADPIVEVVWCP